MHLYMCVLLCVILGVRADHAFGLCVTAAAYAEPQTESTRSEPETVQHETCSGLTLYTAAATEGSAGPAASVVCDQRPSSQSTAAAEQPVQHVWQQVSDSSSGCYYYYNQDTQETTWEVPALVLSCSLWLCLLSLSVVVVCGCVCGYIRALENSRAAIFLCDSVVLYVFHCVHHSRLKISPCPVSEFACLKQVKEQSEITAYSDQILFSSHFFPLCLSNAFYQLGSAPVPLCCGSDSAWWLRCRQLDLHQLRRLWKLSLQRLRPWIL